MVLALGKLTIIIGAGLVGSVLAKEGRTPSVYDLFTGTSKVLKLFKHDDKPTSNSKPLHDSLLAEVNSLRQELQILALNRSVTIINPSGGATSKYGIIVIVAVVGYGYVWWKGWKLPDMMFATRRSLSDATNAVAKQLDTVNSSLAGTKRHLSSRIDRVDCSLDEVAEITTSTEEEVSDLRGKTKVFPEDVQSIHNKVYTLESKLNIIALKQDETNLGVGKLIRTAIEMENQGNQSSSSKPAIELQQTAMSLPPVQIEEIQSSSLPVSPKAKQPLETTVSASGLKVIKDALEESRNTPWGLNIAEGSSRPRVFGRSFSGFTSAFTRTNPQNTES